MRQILNITFAVFLAASTAVVAKEPAVMTKTMQQDAGVRQAVQHAFDAWLAALSSGSPARILQLYDDHAILLATLAAEPLKTQTAREAYFTGLMKNKNLKATVTETHTAVLSDTAASTSGLWTFSFEQDGKTVEIPARFTLVFEKKQDGWKIIQMHSSKVPQQ